MKKMILNMILVVCFVAGFIPMVTYAQTVEEADYSFNTETGRLFIKNDNGTTSWREDTNIAKEDVKSVEFQRLDTPVLNIGENAFEGCVNLTGPVKLNAQTKSIGKDAFKDCDNIDLILIPQTVQGDIEAAGIPDQVAYVVFTFDRDTFYFFVNDIHYGAQNQICLPDDNIYDGTWSCSGIYLVCEDKYDVLPAKQGGLAWYYRMESDGEVTVTRLVTSSEYRICITLPESFCDLSIKQYADDAFDNTGLTASNIIVVDEGIDASIPAGISKIIITTEGENKVAYLTAGNSGTLSEWSMGQINLPRDVSTFYLKDIEINSAYVFMMDAMVVPYEEKENGDIVITNILSGMPMWETYTVPVTIEGKPVTSVMINSEFLPMNQLEIEGSISKIIYKLRSNDQAAVPEITQIVQGNAQASVEIPAKLEGRAIGDVSANVFDKNVAYVCVPEGVNVTQPENVCKIVYVMDADGQVIITGITPGLDENGEAKKVMIPEFIDGKKPVVSESLKKDLVNIPHEHSGGIANCTVGATCDYCGQSYGSVDSTNHTQLVHVARKEATYTAEGNIEYWYCGDCDTCFKDETATMEITLAETVIPKLNQSASDGTDSSADTNQSGEKGETLNTKNESASPVTGDDANISCWLIVVICATVTLSGTIRYKRKRKCGRIKTD